MSLLGWKRTSAPAADNRERIDVLGSLEIFRGAPTEALGSLAESIQEEHVAAEKAVIRQGRVPTHFYIVRQGSLDVLSTGERGSETVRVNTVTVGDFFGEIGLIEGMPSTATVQAVTDCRLWRIPGRAFLSVMDLSPSLSDMLIERVAHKLATTHPSYRPVVERGPGEQDASTALIVRRLAALGGGAGMALSPEGRDHLFGSVAFVARTLFRARACAICMADDGTAPIVRAAAFDDPADDPSDAAPAVAAWVMASEEPLSIPDAAADERARGGPSGPLLAVPIEGAGRRIGSIQVWGYARPDGLQALTVIAELASLALTGADALSDLVRALVSTAAVPGRHGAPSEDIAAEGSVED